MYPPACVAVCADGRPLQRKSAVKGAAVRLSEQFANPAHYKKKHLFLFRMPEAVLKSA